MSRAARIAGRPRLRTLAGSRALVTGASSGLGRAVALALARTGCRVLATARRGERLATLARECGGIDTIAGDITDDHFRAALPEAAVDRLGGLDLVVAAAGSGAIAPLRDGSAPAFRRLLEIDLVAPLELARACLPALGGSPDPGVVLVGSILGLHPLPLHGEYAAAKAALRSLAGALRTELAADAVDVLLVSLGPIESEFWDHLLVGSRPPWSRGRPLPADRAARAILAGLVHRRAEILPGWQAKGFAFAARFVPGLIDAFVARNWRNPAAPADESSPSP